MNDHRRKLDRVLDPEFVAGIEELDLDEVRDRRNLANEVENELSFYRRMLHGRIDLIRFEQRRRTGEESRSLIEALPDILRDDDARPGGRGRPLITDLPPFPAVGHREIDRMMADDVLLRLAEIGDDDLRAALDGIAEFEQSLSEQRRAVQDVADRLTGELGRRYRADSDADAPTR